MNSQNRNNILQIFLTVFIVAIAVGIGMYIWQNTKSIEKNSQNNIADNQTEIIEENQNTPINNTSIELENEHTEQIIEINYSYNDPEWEIIKSDIETKTGETLNSARKSATNANIIFVSTYKEIFEDNKYKNSNKIYSYNIKTGELSKIYDEKADRTLFPVAIQGEKLIVTTSLIDYSPGGPCHSIWLWDNYFYLNIDNPSGLLPYTVPEYQLQKKIQEMENCEALMQVFNNYEYEQINKKPKSINYKNILPKHLGKEKYSQWRLTDKINNVEKYEIEEELFDYGTDIPYKTFYFRDDQYFIMHDEINNMRSGGLVGKWEILADQNLLNIALENGVSIKYEVLILEENVLGLREINN